MSDIKSNENWEVFKGDELTDDQKTYIALNYDKKSLIELTRYITKDKNADGRHKMGRIIRAFLATKGLEAETTKFKKADELVLTEEQEEFLRNNISIMKPLEAARILFKNEKISPLHNEFKVVYKFIDKITPGITKREDAFVDGDYKAPTSIFKVMQIVNKFVPNQKKENEPTYKSGDKLTAQDLKNLKALLSYMQLTRYGLKANSYRKQIDRDIFESTFIGMTYDKSDLQREEIEQYISLASEIVTTEQIDRGIQFLDQQMEDIVTGNAAEGAKLSMTLIESINAARERLDKSKERQKKLIAELTGSRAERMKGRIDANASILNLVDAWRDEKKRNEMLQLAMRQKQNEKDQCDELAGMDSILALIAGITKNEVT
jgi:hypothetical protein